MLDLSCGRPFGLLVASLSSQMFFSPCLSDYEGTMHAAMQQM